MEYKIGLRNRVALCITLPKKAAEAKGMTVGTRVVVEEVPEGLLIKKAGTPPKQAIPPEVVDKAVQELAKMEN